MSITILQDTIRARKTPIALGLKPELEKVSAKVRKNFTDMFGAGTMADAEALRWHGTQLLEAVAGKLPAVVIHAESYLRFGMMGADVLSNLVGAAHAHGLYVILAVNTAEPRLWESYGADAVTVNPYVGSDCCDAGERQAVFAVVRTAGAGAVDVQNLIAGDRPLYLAVADQMARHGAGLVLASGYSLDVKELRRRCPDSFLLLPYCDGENAMPAFNDYGHGAMVVNFDLQYAENPGEAADAAIREMKTWVSVL